jgi:hypothetical protein
MSRPKSFNRDQEICWDLKISAFLDSLSWSWSRSKWIFAFSCWDFSIRWDFNINMTKSQLKILDFKNLDNLNKNMNMTQSWLKSLKFNNLDRNKKKVCLDSWENLDRFQKLISTDGDVSISILIDLNCWDPQAYFIPYLNCPFDQG